MASTVFGQVNDLYFSMYGEGSSNNKFVQIYNGTDSTISLDNYAFPTVSNDPDVPGEYEYWNTFPSGASIAPGDVFVIAHPSADATILAEADMTFTYLSNGDDGMALVKGGTFNDLDADGNVDAGEMTGFEVLDWLGDWNGDPGAGWDVAGVSAATKNHTLIRKSSVCSGNDDWDAARGTNTDDSEWIVNDIDTGWDLLGSYEGCVAAPILTITSPAEGDVLNPEAANSMEVTFTVENFIVDVPSAGQDGHIHYNVDGGSTVMIYTTEPITLTNIGTGPHTLNMWLVDNNHNPLDPPVEASVNFEIAQYINVANLAELRASDTGNYYKVTGEIVITGGDVLSSGTLIGFLQDDTAGIYVYAPDPTPLIEEDYEIFDGLTGFKGMLSEYHGMLEIIPTASAGPATSSNNVVVPQTVTWAELNANGEDYEAELVKIENATVSDVDTGDGTFQYGESYPMDDGDTGVLRTLFPSADYIGTNLPTDARDWIGLVSEYDGVYRITPRYPGDIQYVGVEEQGIAGFRLYPNPAENTLFIQTDSNASKQVDIYDITGKHVISYPEAGNSIDISSLDKGMYIVKVRQSGYESIEKLMVK